MEPCARARARRGLRAHASKPAHQTHGHIVAYSYMLCNNKHQTQLIQHVYRHMRVIRARSGFCVWDGLWRAAVSLVIPAFPGGVWQALPSTIGDRKLALN